MKLKRFSMKSPSTTLKASRDYYRERADDPATPEGDRPLWAQLADEIDARLGANPAEGQGELFA